MPNYSPQDPSSRGFQQYQLLEKLGAGGMGQVFKARDTRLNRFVAVKMLPDHMSADPERRRRFVQEAQAASALNHPNIITIYDIVLEADRHYMVVEYIAGKTLTELIPKEGMRSAQAVQYAAQIADGLSAAHAAGIVHRDLKPSNIMVLGSGLVKLLDFGLAKMIEAEMASPDSETRTMIPAPMTMEGALMGTVNYMSPEQAEGRRVDARSDIFSYGSVLYEMLTGRCAFQGGSTVATLSSVLRDEVKPIRELSPEVPPALEQIVVRCLKKDPAARYQSMQEVQAALAPLKLRSDVREMRAHHEKAAPRRGRFVWVLAVLALAAGGGYWWTTQQHSAQPPKAPRTASVAPPSSEEPHPTPERPPTPEAESKPPSAVVVTDGLPVRLVLSDDIPANASEGDSVKFEVAADIRLGGKIVIRKGASATGSIVENPRKIPVLGRKMTLRFDTVELADGETMSLRATPNHVTSGPSKRAVDNGGSKKKDVAAAAGTAYVGYVDGNKTLDDLK